MVRIIDGDAVTDREMTDTELQAYNGDIETATIKAAAQAATVKSQAAAKKSAEKKLAALGLTADEIAAL